MEKLEPTPNAYVWLLKWTINLLRFVQMGAYLSSQNVN